MELFYFLVSAPPLKPIFVSKASSGSDPTSSNSDRESFAPVSGSIARSTDNAIQGAHDNVSIDTDLRGGIATRKGDSST